MLERYKSEKLFLLQSKNPLRPMPALLFPSKITSRMHVSYGEGFTKQKTNLKYLVQDTSGRNLVTVFPNLNSFFVLRIRTHTFNQFSLLL